MLLVSTSDIQFWNKNKSMEGLSAKSVIVSFISQLIVFLYLLDNDTSWMILASSGIGCCIEFWKIGKAMHIEVAFIFNFFTAHKYFFLAFAFLICFYYIYMCQYTSPYYLIKQYAFMFAKFSFHAFLAESSNVIRSLAFPFWLFISFVLVAVYYLIYYQLLPFFNRKQTDDNQNLNGNYGNVLICITRSKKQNINAY